MHACVFLPLTRDTATRLWHDVTDEHRARVLAVRQRAEEAETAAAHCWTSLLAGCDRLGRQNLVPYLHRLAEATSLYAGSPWWFSSGTAHRLRVVETQDRIETAVADGDGQEFAQAFIGYDHAVASAVTYAREPAQRP